MPSEWENNLSSLSTASTSSLLASSDATSPEPNTNGNNNNNDLSKHPHDRDSASKSNVSNDPMAYVARARVTRPAPPKPSCNPMQFVQIRPCNLYQSAQQQLKKAEEIKKVKEVMKEDPEDWQNNLDNWKSSRRKRVEHIIDRVVEVKKLEQEEHERTRRKAKTFSEMIEERGERSRVRQKLQSLASYTEDEGNDLSDLGIGTSSASGKSSTSEDCEVHSIVNESAEVENTPLFDIENNSCLVYNDLQSSGRISLLEYEASSSIQATSPVPYEYTYEGAIEDYKSRVSKATTTSIYKTPHNTEHCNTKSLVFERKTTDNENTENSLPMKKKDDIPKVDISKKRELFEKPEVVKTPTEAPTIMQSQEQSEKKTNPTGLTNFQSIKDRLCSLEKKNDWVDDTPANIIPGEITSVKERLQCLEQQKQQSSVNLKPNTTKAVAEVASAPPLKERLSSLQNALTKEEVKKPVCLVDEYQLEALKNEERARRQLMNKEEDLDKKSLNNNYNNNNENNTNNNKNSSNTNEDSTIAITNPTITTPTVGSISSIEGLDQKSKEDKQQNLNTPTVVNLVDKPVIDVGGGNSCIIKRSNNDGEVNHAQNLLKMFKMVFSDEIESNRVITSNEFSGDMLSNKGDVNSVQKQTRIPTFKSNDSNKIQVQDDTHLDLSTSTLKITEEIYKQPVTKIPLSKVNDLKTKNPLIKGPKLEHTKSKQSVIDDAKVLQDDCEIQPSIVITQSLADNKSKTPSLQATTQQTLVTNGNKSDSTKSEDSISGINMSSTTSSSVDQFRTDNGRVEIFNSKNMPIYPKSPDVLPQVTKVYLNGAKFGYDLVSEKEAPIESDSVLSKDVVDSLPDLESDSKTHNNILRHSCQQSIPGPNLLSSGNSPSRLPVSKTSNLPHNNNKPTTSTGLHIVSSDRDYSQLLASNPSNQLSKSSNRLPTTSNHITGSGASSRSSQQSPCILSAGQPSADLGSSKSTPDSLCHVVPKSCTDLDSNLSHLRSSTSSTESQSPLGEAILVKASVHSPPNLHYSSDLTDHQRQIKVEPNSPHIGNLAQLAKVPHGNVTNAVPADSSHNDKPHCESLTPLPFEECANILQSFLDAERTPEQLNYNSQRSIQNNGVSSGSFIREISVNESPCSKVDVKTLPKPDMIPTAYFHINDVDKPTSQFQGQNLCIDKNNTSLGNPDNSISLHPSPIPNNSSLAQIASRVASPFTKRKELNPTQPQPIHEEPCQKLDVNTLPDPNFIHYTPCIEVDRKQIRECESLPVPTPPSSLDIQKINAEQIRKTCDEIIRSPPLSPNLDRKNFIIARKEIVETKIKVVTTNDADIPPPVPASPPPALLPASPKLKPKSTQNISKPRNIFEFIKKNFQSKPDVLTSESDPNVTDMEPISIDNSKFYVPVELVIANKPNEGDTKDQQANTGVNIEITKTIRMDAIIENPDSELLTDEMLNDEISKIVAEDAKL